MGADEQDETTSDLARVLYETAVLRSGFTLKDSGDFAMRIERMLRLSMGVDLTTEAEKEEFPDEEEEEEEEVGDDEGKPLSLVGGGDSPVISGRRLPL